MLAGALTDWPRFVQRAFDNLSPGGWLELADITFPTQSDDGTLAPDSPLMQWNEHVIKAGHTLNHSIEEAKKYKRMMLDAGFINVSEKLYKWPINAWPRDTKYKEIGACLSCSSCYFYTTWDWDADEEGVGGQVCGLSTISVEVCTG